MAPSGGLGLTAAAGLFPVGAVIVAGRPAGLLCWAAASVLGLLLLPNKGGKVVFEHLAHAETYGIECDACHHTGDYEIPCGECHNAEAAEEQGIPARMEAFHLNCMGCHEEMGVGPYGKDQCNQCHVK